MKSGAHAPKKANRMQQYPTNLMFTSEDECADSFKATKEQEMYSTIPHFIFPKISYLMNSDFIS